MGYKEDMTAKYINISVCTETMLTSEIDTVNKNDYLLINNILLKVYRKTCF
jgi:hypothetical protein